MSKIELEMMQDEFRKALPMMKTVTKPFAELIKANYDEIKLQGFSEHQSMYMAVQASAKQMGFN